MTDFPQLRGFEDTEPGALDMRNTDLGPLEVVKAMYPRIYRQIVGQWGTQTLQNNLMRWLFTDQFDRKGWTPEMQKALKAICAEHIKRYGFVPDTDVADLRDTW
jgi:hypothetical protein